MKYVINRSKAPDDRWIVTVWQVVDYMFYEKEHDAVATVSILSSTLKADERNEVALQVEGKLVSGKV